MKRAFPLIVMILLISSCSYKLQVVDGVRFRERAGYLVFFNRQVYFFPQKKIEGNHFFMGKLNMRGYLVHFEMEELYCFAGEKYTIDHEYPYEGKYVFVRDTVYITPVKIRSRPSQRKEDLGRSGPFTLRYGDTVRRLRVRVGNNEWVWYVNAIFPDDKKEVAEYFNK